MAAGVAAIGALAFSHGKTVTHDAYDVPNRTVESVSARAATSESETIVDDNIFTQDLWGSTDLESTVNTKLPKRSENDPRVREAMKFVRARFPLEPNYSKSLGVTGLRVCTDMATTKQKPKVSSEMFNMPESYASQLEEQ